MPFTIYIYGINEDRILIQAFVLLFVAVIQFRHLFILENIKESVFIHREPNVTNVNYLMYIDIPYEDCRCNVVSSELCLTDLQFKYTHILPLILFILEIYILKDILSLNYYRRYFLINLYWIASIFLFFCLLIIIHGSTRHYDLGTFTLFYLGMLLYFCCAASVVIP